MEGSLRSTHYPKEEQGGNLFFAIMLTLVYHNTEEECQHLSNVLANFKAMDLDGECITNFVTQVQLAVNFLQGSHAV